MAKSSLFSQFSLPFAWWWVIVPNICAIAMWPIGGPAMTGPMAEFGLMAFILCHLESRIAKRVGIAVIFLLSVQMYVATSFNLNSLKFFNAYKFVLEINPFQSLEYAVAITVVLVGLVLAVRYAPYTPRLANRGQRIMAVATIAMLINVDAIATAGTRGSYNISAPEGAPIDAATIQNEISPRSLQARNLVVIIVESMGVANNAHDEAIFDRIWNSNQWEDRYRVAKGTTVYYGATTNAELREWCHAWADYKDYDFASADCLGKDFRRAGFHTVAFHNFEETFFERSKWWPDLGFEKMVFKDAMLVRGAKPCGGVWEIVCDRNVPHMIGNELRRAPEQRKLIYWLTMGGHVPIAADEASRTAQCSLGDRQWNEDFPMLCRSYLVQQHLADAITREIMRADFPEADILIVGDHMPPFFPRAIRTRFDSARVPWIMLRDRAALDRAGAEVARPDATETRS